jgi:hypothetical protein
MAEAEKVVPDAGHEPTDVGEGFVWGAFSLLLGSLVAITLVILWLFPNSTLDRTITLPTPVYPDPRLQPSPRDDMQAFYREEIQRLNSLGWIDQGHGIVHIPITDAMRRIAQQGIPDWPKTPGNKP